MIESGVKIQNHAENCPKNIEKKRPRTQIIGPKLMCACGKEITEDEKAIMQTLVYQKLYELGENKGKLAMHEKAIEIFNSMIDSESFRIKFKHEIEKELGK